MRNLFSQNQENSEKRSTVIWLKKIFFFLSALSKESWILNVLSTQVWNIVSLDVNENNLVSHRFIIEKGRSTLIVFLDNPGHSSLILY